MVGEDRCSDSGKAGYSSDNKEAYICGDVRVYSSGKEAAGSAEVEGI